MTIADTAPLPMVLDEVEVAAVERLSPSFVRLHFAGPALGELGVDGPLYDQRLKVILPNAAGRLPSFADADQSWWDTWLDIPEHERGSMRTYTIRDLSGEGEDRRLVLDVVVHEGGVSGPGNDWALGAQVGDRVIVLAPRRGHDFGGIEFAPEDADELLLVGDETAVPAVAGILRDLPSTARGAAYLEVPVDGDVQGLPHPAGVTVRWVARNGAFRGERLRAAVLAHLGATHLSGVPVGEVPDDLWETPTYSATGEDLDAEGTVVGHDLEGLYAWIAGESRVVTSLRRALVNDLGLARTQVAFMGYWREGVAMRS